ncbi:MAG: hypothetical protein ACI8V4_002607 [Ilumatobacter sp.]
MREGAGPAGNRRAIGGQEHRGRLRRDADLDPTLERGIPEHRERIGAVVVDEFIGVIKVVLGSEANDLDRAGVVSSELLDIGGFPTAGGSMRCVHPQENWLLLGDEIS